MLESAWAQEKWSRKVLWKNCTRKVHWKVLPKRKWPGQSARPSKKRKGIWESDGHCKSMYTLPPSICKPPTFTPCWLNLLLQVAQVHLHAVSIRLQTAYIHSHAGSIHCYTLPKFTCTLREFTCMKATSTHTLPRLTVACCLNSLPRCPKSLTHCFLSLTRCLHSLLHAV